MPISVESKLSKLSTGLKSTHASPHSSGVTLPSQPSATPDSWEDEDNETGDTVIEAPGPSLKQITSNDGPAPPPPTPISPQNNEGFMSRKWETDSGRPTARYGQADQSSVEKRPEKSTATANRMIAGALGIKAPKKTEEQKQYDKATREAEIKRRAREKEAKEQERLADEQAKADIWGS